jgi:hypothetical protein
MKVRELLKYEIWSKRTTRKILVWSGAFLGFVIAFLTIWILIERHWLTPGERRAGREALAQIDGLQDFQSMSAQDFSLKYHKAENEIDAARMSAWTWKDKGVTALLDWYLRGTWVDREEMLDRERIERTRPDIAAKEAESTLERESMEKRAGLALRSELHAFLD